MVNINSFKEHCADEWVKLFKEGAYRGLKINRLAECLQEAQSFVYNPLLRQLTLIDKTGNPVIVSLAEVLKQKPEWTFSRVIHEIKMLFLESYSSSFNSRIENLAMKIIQFVPNPAQNKIDFALDPNSKINWELFDSNLIEGQMNTIVESRGNKRLKSSLLALKDKIFTSAVSPSARVLAFKIQGIAMGLTPDPSGFWNKLPLEIQVRIFHEAAQSRYKCLGLGSFKSMSSVSKQAHKAIFSIKISMVNSWNLGLKGLGCKNAKEAVQFVIDHKLISANFAHFTDFSDDDIEALEKNASHFRNLVITSSKVSQGKLVNFLNQLTSLERLSLQGCNLLDEGALAIAIEKMPNLQELILGHISSIIGDKLVPAFKKTPKLDALYFLGCVNMKEGFCEEVKSAYPDITYVHVSSVVGSNL